jgi:transcriptional antiterminator RfaH
MNLSSKSDSYWYVLYTKPRAEKKLAQQLQDDGIEAYCPTQVQLKVWSDRKKKVETPLLPSMILVHIENEKRELVFNRKNATRYLYWLGQPAKVSSQEVEGLKSLLDDSQFEHHGLQKMQAGVKLDMTSLGFEHIQGTVTYTSTSECWIVLEGLGYVVKFKKKALKF